MQISGSDQRLGAQSTKEPRVKLRKWFFAQGPGPTLKEMPRNCCSQWQGLILSPASARQISTLTLN